MEIRDVAQYEAAAREVQGLVRAGQYAKAVALAESATGDENLLVQFRAYAYAEAGEQSSDLELLTKAATIWASVAEASPSHLMTRYNQANTEKALFMAAYRAEGLVSALETKRSHLYLARSLYAVVGDNREANDSLRLTALTNLGNTYDDFGRDVDGIASYDRAIAIDPTFGMAQGNKGMALLHLAPLMEEHQPRVLSDAVDALDRAPADRERVLEIGGPRALEDFEKARARINVEKAPPGSAAHTHAEDESSRDNWADPYLSWCREQGLFLHVSPACLTAKTTDLDPLFFGGLIRGLTDKEGARVDQLVDAFNAIKQDYVATRYLAWLVSDAESPIRDQTAALSEQVKFLDSLSYARWGVRTGMASQGFAAATNLLDKVAAFVHLYLESDRKATDVYFRTLWRKPRKNKPDVMTPALAAEIAAPGGNRGLVALCDLSCELELGRETHLRQLVDRRHSATHRFLVAHDESVPDGGETDEWLERITWVDLVDGLLGQLQIARAALMYLARTVQIREARVRRDLEEAGKIVASLPAFEAWTENPNLD